MTPQAIEQTTDFGHTLLEMLTHLERRRGFQRPIRLAVIDQAGQMMLQTIKADGGVTLHYPDLAGDLGYHAWYALPMHLLLVDRDGQAVKATIGETGQWLLG